MPARSSAGWTYAARKGSWMRFATIAVIILSAGPARSETAQEWIALGTRVHGGFGSFIPVGIRIGEDALRRLGVARREVSMVDSSGPNAPCPSVADGIAIATEASVGQGTLQVMPETSPPGTFGLAVIRDKRSGKSWRYTIPASTHAASHSMEQRVRCHGALHGRHGCACAVRGY